MKIKKARRQKNINNRNKPEHNNKNSNDISMQFIASGIACNALCLIHYAGILKKILTHGKFQLDDLQEYKNPNLIISALISLVGAKVLALQDESYKLTNLGKQLAKKIGFITMPFIGYGKLIAKQLELLDCPDRFSSSDIDFKTVALSSINFGMEDLDPLLINIINSIKPRGTICDLGCGTGHKLIKLCKATSLPGLGIEFSEEAIEAGTKLIDNSSQIEIVAGDITNLNGIWEDVSLCIISFVCHDINPLSKCSQILNSYQSHFPRMEYVVVIDIVSPSRSVTTFMPGFDYVHGLQGFIPRNYEDTLLMFEKGDYFILQETCVPNMPNTFIWVLKRNTIF